MNYLYVIGLPEHLSDEVLLKEEFFFGQFGKVVKLVINNQPKAYHNGQIGIYIEYENPLSVAIAILVSYLILSFHYRP